MGRIVLSFFLLIGIRSGCVCRPLGIGLMILLSGISELGIFVHWKLLRMLRIL